MAQILQRDLFVRRLSIYRARISRWISSWISMWIGVRIFESPHARKYKTLLDSGFHAMDFRIPVLDPSLFLNWNLDFGFQSFVGFRIH